MTKRKDPKMVAAGRKASQTKGYEVERDAAEKAWDTMKLKAAGQTHRENHPDTFTCSECTCTLPVGRRAPGPEPLCRDCA